MDHEYFDQSLRFSILEERLHCIADVTDEPDMSHRGELSDTGLSCIFSSTCSNVHSAHVAHIGILVLVSPSSRETDQTAITLTSLHTRMPWHLAFRLVTIYTFRPPSGRHTPIRCPSTFSAKPVPHMPRKSLRLTSDRTNNKVHSTRSLDSLV